MFTGPPVITSNGGGASAAITIAENTSSVADVDATDFAANRTAIIDKFNNEYVAPRAVTNGWTGSAATCDAGTNSAAYEQATETTINYFRSMTGLPGITLDSALNAEAMEAALMMHANGALSHSPPNTWNCYTATGAAAAGSSNLSLGRAGPRAIADGYVQDPGPNNYFVGHRRWVLYPRMVKMGSGSTTGANALKVFGGSGQHGSRPASPDWVSWPPEGFVPGDVAYQRWSLSSNDFPFADFNNATVTMTVDGSPISVFQQPVNNGGFGDRTLVWEPQTTFSNNQTVSVTVSDINLDGQNVVTHSYDVTIIDPAAAPSGSGLTYALTGSLPDNGLFNVNSTTGDLSFVAPPDFESPQDADGNNVYELQVTTTDDYGLTDTQSISVTVTDVVEDALPNIVTSSPVNLTDHPPGNPVEISGQAADDNSVVQVNLAIYNDTNQTWDGAAFTSNYSIVVATLGSPGSTSTSWTYDFMPPTEGTYGVRATAVDDALQVRRGWWYTFLVGTDTAQPGITVTNPVSNNSVLTGPLSGMANDDRGINRVSIVIYNSANQTWNGTAFTSAYTRVNATLGALNGTATSWSYNFTGLVGIYTFRATAIDVVNKQTNSSWLSFEIT